MSMSALRVVIRPPEPGIEFDVEAGDRFAPSTYVEILGVRGARLSAHGLRDPCRHPFGRR